jgi:hypothetical protein
MKKFVIVASALVLGSAALSMAQSAPASGAPVIGRGRSGAPYAWNDKNKDGICDLTGRPVGQGPGAAAMRGGFRGRGAGPARGRGMGRGFGARQRQVAPAQN